MIVLAFVAKSNAQVIWDSTYAVDVQTCLRSESMIVKFTATATHNAGATVRVALPQGLTYTSAVAVTKNGSATPFTVATSSAGRVVTFTITNSFTTADIMRIEFKQFASCQAGISTYTVRDTIRMVSSAGTFNRNGDLFNGSSPDLSITSITNSPGTGTVGSVITRRFKITNGGFGATKNFIIVDKFTTGQVTMNTSSVTANGVSVSAVSSVVGDSLIISMDKATILSMGSLTGGNNDTLFANGESFFVEYTFTVNTCTPTSLTSTLLTNWRCPNSSRCNWFSVATGIGTTGPPAPSIVFLKSLKRQFDCFNSSSIFRDTLLLKNNGGPATDISIDGGVNRGATFNSGWEGFSPLDTASLRVKIGKNGTFTKPSFIVATTATGNFSGYGNNCNFLGQPSSVRFTVANLGAGDTLYIILGQKYCDYQFPSCISSQSFNSSVYPCGTGIKFTYKNACRNATYDGGWVDAFTYRNIEMYGTNDGPVSLVDGQIEDLKLNIDLLTQNADPYRFNFGYRGYTEITVKLPSVIQFDPAYTRPVYFTDQSGTNVYPYATSGDSFKFRMRPDFYYQPTVLHVKVKGVCDGVTCAGIIYYSIIVKQNPDTAFCNHENQQICLRYPLSWGSTCIPNCCPKGMVNTFWSVKRLNTGLADDDDNGTPSGTLNKSLLRLDRAIVGDTIEFIHKYYFKTNSLHTKWDYARSLFDASVPSYYSVISDSVFVDRAANGAGLDSVFNTTPTISGSYYVTNISPMAAFQNNDTVTIKLKLKVTGNGSCISWTPEITGGASNVPGFDSSFMCGPFLQKMQIVYVDGFGYTSMGILGINGCAQRVTDLAHYVRLGCITNTYDRLFFPYEYRKVGYPDLLKYKIPANYRIDSLELNYITQNKFGTTGAAQYPSNYKPGTNIPYTVVNDTIFFRIGNNLKNIIGGTYPLEEGFYTYYRLYMTPTCKVPHAAILGSKLQDSFVFFTENTKSAYSNKTSSAIVNGTQYQNFHPNLIYSVAVPVSAAYNSDVSWPFTMTDLSVFNATFNWIYFKSNDGKITIDSLKEGTTKITPDVNGFYRVGTVNAGATRSFVVYGTNTSCTFDSIQIYPGYACGGLYPTAFTDTVCKISALPLYAQPQQAGIQTQITGLGATPINPATGTAPLYGRADVDMCKSFPFEMEIQSTQPGDIFKVKENILLPFSGSGVGLDLLIDSIYVEYPIGTTPRLANWTGRSLMASSAPGGTMVMDLEKLDSLNFNASNGLPGTGLGSATTRKIKIRWKMRANCNLISGSQWNAIQKAITACGSNANGDGTRTSGFKINVLGAPAPKSAIFLNTTPPIATCGSNVTYSMSMRSLAASATTSSDSLTVVLASGGQYVSGTTNFTKNPSGATPNPKISFSNGRQILTWPASGIPSFDTVKWSFQVTSSSANTLCSDQDSADLQFSTTFNPLCGLTTCNSKVLNSSNRVAAVVKKPNLDYTTGTGTVTYTKDTNATHLTIPDTLKVAGLNFTNTGNDTARGPVATFWYDANNNNAIDVGETTLATTTLPNVAPGATYTWNQTMIAAHNAVPCDNKLKMRLSQSCNCDSVNQVATFSIICRQVNTPMASLGNKVWLDDDKDGIQDAGEMGVAGVTVTLYDATGKVVASTTTDAYGTYLFTNLPPGSYSVQFTPPANYDFTTQTTGTATGSDANPGTGRTNTVTLTGGQTNLDLDAGLIQASPAGQNVGDYVWFDTDKDGVQDAGESGLAGVTVTLYDNTGKVIGTTVTDNNGKYLFTGVPAGTYTVGFTPPIGLVGTTQTSGNATGSDMSPSTFKTAAFTVVSGTDRTDIDAGFYSQPATTASLGNLVWNDLDNDGAQDAGEPGVSGVTVTLYNSGGTAIGSTVTDAFGNYVFNNLAPGTYSVGFTGIPSGFSLVSANVGGAAADSTDSDANTGTGRTGNYTLVAGEKNMSVDAGIFSAANPYTLGNFVWVDADKDGIQDPSESGIAGVMVILLNSSGTPMDTTYTDANGNYKFTNLAAGTYSVQVKNLPSGYSISPKDATSDAADSDAGANGITSTVTLGSGNPNDMTLDIGLMPGTTNNYTASLGDKVWYDLDGDGIQDAGEPGAPGVKVYLYGPDGTTLVDSTVTDASGKYIFTGLNGGDYYVGVKMPTGWSTTPVGAGGDATADNNGNAPAGGISKSNKVTLNAGEENLSIDFGINKAGVLVVGDKVFLDANKNGVDDGEVGVAGIGVRLIDASGNVVATAVTDANGNYLFVDVPAASGYRIQFTNLPTGYKFSAKDTSAASNDLVDSDPNKTTGYTDPFTVTSSYTYSTNPATTQRSYDAGIYPATVASVAGTYWVDADGDGIQDAGEAGIPGMRVTLYDNSGNPVASTITDANGNYLFPNVTPGNGYSIGFEAPPSGTTITTQNATGSNATNNSEADPITRKTVPFNLAAGEVKTDVDAGVKTIVPASIGDRIWLDVNYDGQQNAAEDGVAGVVLQLLDGSGNVVATTVTDANGNYLFSNLPPGNYKVKILEVPTGLQMTRANVGADATDSDFDQKLKTTATITLAAGENKRDIDGGLAPLSTAALGSYVWLDNDIDGVSDGAPAEPGLPGVKVYLWDMANNIIVDSMVTPASGIYLFDTLLPGIYKVQFVKAGYKPTYDDIRNNTRDSWDSDIDATGFTKNITLGKDSVKLTIWAGMIPSAVPLNSDFLNFMARLNHAFVNLNWDASVDESILVNYEVIRKYNNGTWTTVLVKKPAGLKAYNGIDDLSSQPGGRYFYQLILKNTASETRSSIVAIDYLKEFNRSVMFVPNPTSGVFNILLTNWENGAASISLVSQDGRVVMKQTSTANLITVDGSKLSGGVYTVRIEKNGIVATEKIVISK